MYKDTSPSPLWLGNKILSTRNVITKGSSHMTEAKTSLMLTATMSNLNDVSENSCKMRLSRSHASIIIQT
jgi:hypothetical protein